MQWREERGGEVKDRGSHHEEEARKKGGGRREEGGGEGEREISSCQMVPTKQVCLHISPVCTGNGTISLIKYTTANTVSVYDDKVLKFN